MCGIAGLTGPGSDRLDLVRTMTAMLTHRGPDEHGFYDDESISMGQRRLSIIDLNTGRQPIEDDSGNLVLICNGEIYNSPDLRKEFSDDNYPFKTQTDVEVILPLYKKYGNQCVQYLRGMFAFAIWNKVEKSLYLARDHLGQKPLYFCNTRDGLAFASEVKALLATEDSPRDINLECIWHYISMRYVPDQHTFFKGIHKLPAASWLSYSKNQIAIENYWHPEFEPKATNNIDELTEQLDALLSETIDLHCLSDVRVGAFLSGGIDSSIISAKMAQRSSETIPVFSIGVEDQQYNEIPWAEMVARQYKMEHHKRIVNPNLIHLLPKLIYHLDEPSDPYGFGVFLCSKLASEHVKVVLSGDGGDENFGGYDRYSGQKMAQLYAILPNWFRKHLVQRMINLAPDSFGYKSAVAKAKWLNEMSFFQGGERYMHSMSILRFPDQSKHKLFTPNGQDQIEDKDSLAKLMRHFNAGNATELVDKMLNCDLMTRLPDHLLTISDRMSMAHSLEVRSPFVDHKLVEFAARLPTSCKIKNTQLKYILKKVAGKHLSNELVNRSKQGFGFPIAHWMRSELSVFMKNLFKQSRFVELGIFNHRYIDQLVDEHVGGASDHNFRLWILINLELWYRIYYEGLSNDQMREFTGSLMSDG